jgi:hypothetical protein
MYVNPGNTQMFFIDVNGNKKPNVMGKDIFRISYGSGGVGFCAGQDKRHFNR